jgi:hypothetical protein
MSCSIGFASEMSGQVNIVTAGGNLNVFVKINQGRGAQDLFKVLPKESEQVYTRQLRTQEFY